MKNLKPITREETMLAKAAGQDVPTLEPVTREEYFLSDVIEAIESGGGGGGLPAVTSDDNGDVLTVVEGAWAKATPSGGGVFIVNLNETIVDNTSTWTSDKTYAQIKDAFESGKNIIGYVTHGELYDDFGDFNVYQFSGISYEDGEEPYGEIDFERIQIESRSNNAVYVSKYFIAIYLDDTITYVETTKNIS